MNLGEISFCNKIAYNVKGDETKKIILDKLNNKYGLKIITRHFDKFEEKLMTNINKNAHLLCARSNGNPYFLLLTKINDVNFCIFIDKKIQQGYCFPRMIICNYHFDDSLFNDTVFDTEMVKMDNNNLNVAQQNKWVLLINDILVYNSKYLTDINLIKRLNIIYDILKNKYIFDDHDISYIYVKKYFKFNELDYFINEYVSKIIYTCRGMYFKPLFLKFRDILINFDDDLIKKVEKKKYKHEKEFLLLSDKNELNNDNYTIPNINNITNIIEDNINNNTNIIKDNITFNVCKTNNPDVYELYDKNNILQGIACIPTMKISKAMRKIFETKNIVDKIELNFQYNEKFKKYCPII